jgi:hypothetical protein
MDKTECVYSAVQTGFLSKIGVKFCFENYKATCTKYHIKPGVSTLTVIEVG